MKYSDYWEREAIRTLLESAESPGARNRALVASVNISVADVMREHIPTSRVETCMMPPSFFGSFHHHVRVSLELDRDVPNQVFEPSFFGRFAPAQILSRGTRHVEKQQPRPDQPRTVETVLGRRSAQ